MVRYLGDLNKLVYLNESGTYGVSSGLGQWIGHVQNHTVNHEENPIVTRYLGGSTRSYNTTEQGPVDITGTITFAPQDMRIFFHAIGSVRSQSGATATNALHTATQINSDVRQSAYTSGLLNPPFSFTLEDSKNAVTAGSHFNRTVRGVVLDNVTLNINQGEKVTIEANYIAQSVLYSSGASTLVTATTLRPYLWNDAILVLGTGSIDALKSLSLNIAQNYEKPHYINGSRVMSVPYPANRDNTLNVTVDWDSVTAKTIYDTYYIGGSEFNSVLDMNATVTGSQRTNIILSGCKIISMDIPSPQEGTNEATAEIIVRDITATEYSSNANTYNYNPW